MLNRPNKHPLQPSRALLLTGLLAGAAASASAQSIIAPPPPAYSGSMAVDPLAERPLGETDADVLETTLYGGAGALQWGVAHLHPRILYRLIYGTGFQSGTNQADKTFIHEFSPGMFLKLGRHWMLDYAPTMRMYTTGNLEDTLDHNLTLSGGASYRDWTFSLGQSYSLTSQPLVQTGFQTDQETFGTKVSALWSMNQSLALELGLSQNFRFLGGNQAQSALLADSKNWSTLNWLKYMWAPGFNTGIGLGAGYDMVSSGSDMTSEQLLAQISWHVQRRLTLLVSGGGEYRQYLSSEMSPTLTPIITAGADYALFTHTRLSLNVSRTTAPSYFASQTTENTEFSVGLRQRLLTKLELSIVGGVRSYSYASTIVDQGGDLRTDDGFFFTTRLSRGIFKKGTIAIMYSYSENTSSEGGYGYQSDQIALELGYKL